MTLHIVSFTHFSQKDSQAGILKYILAETDEQVVKWVCSHTCCVWDDEEWSAEEGGFYPSEYWWKKNSDAKERALALGLNLSESGWDKVTGPKGKLLLWCRGDFDDPQDLYYGATHYHWDVGVKITEEDAAVLMRLGIAERV